MKCDEAKPACGRCTSTGRKCDGYRSSSDPVSQDKRVVRVQQAPSKGVSFGIQYNALEKRTFDFFRSKTAPCMSGYFQDPVWERLALQASHTEPVIRYAINALGALHEERFLRTEAFKSGMELSLVQTDFPVLQYAKALSGLRLFRETSCFDRCFVIRCLCICLLWGTPSITALIKAN